MKSQYCNVSAFVHAASTLHLFLKVFLHPQAMSKFLFTQLSGTTYYLFPTHLSLITVLHYPKTLKYTVHKSHSVLMNTHMYLTHRLTCFQISYYFFREKQTLIRR